jgi:hypothetical protein
VVWSLDRRTETRHSIFGRSSTRRSVVGPSVVFVFINGRMAFVLAIRLVGNASPGRDSGSQCIDRQTTTTREWIPTSSTNAISLCSTIGSVHDSFSQTDTFNSRCAYAPERSVDHLMIRLLHRRMMRMTRLHDDDVSVDGHGVRHHERDLILLEPSPQRIRLW